MASDDSTIPTEGPLNDADVIDTEFQQVDLDTKNEASDDTLFKLDSLFKGDFQADADRKKASKRRTIINIVSVVVGFVTLICLIVTLKAGNSKSTTDSVKNSADQGKQTEGDTTDPWIGHSPSCSSTALLCPAEKTGLWAMLPDDIIGDSTREATGFATDLSCDGTKLAVSTPLGNNHVGHVRVYEWNTLQKEWNVMGNAINGAGQFDEFGDTLSLSADGMRLAIGSKNNDEGGKNAGHVKVFDYINPIWVQVGDEIRGEGQGDESGTSISLSADGTRLAIGAIANNATDAWAGHVRIYTLDSSGGSAVWKKLGQDIDGEKEGDKSGRSVALSGDGHRVAIGGHSRGEGDLKQSGHVRIFEFSVDSQRWTQVGTDIEGEEQGEWLGMAVALSYDGARVAAGAPGAENSYTAETRVYELKNGKWVQLGSRLEGAGNSVAMTTDGNRVVTGTYHNGLFAGLTVVYDFNGTEWVQVGDDLRGAVGDFFGTSVSISGDGNRIVSSAPRAQVGEVQTLGLVRVFDLC